MSLYNINIYIIIINYMYIYIDIKHSQTNIRKKRHSSPITCVLTSHNYSASFRVTSHGAFSAVPALSCQAGSVVQRGTPPASMATVGDCVPNCRNLQQNEFGLELGIAQS